MEPGLRELVNNAWDRQSIFLFTSETILFKLSREIVCDIWYYDKLSFASSDYGSKIVWEMQLKIYTVLLSFSFTFVVASSFSPSVSLSLSLCCRQLIKFLVDKCNFDFISALRDESRKDFNDYRYAGSCNYSILYIEIID